MQKAKVRRLCRDWLGKVSIFPEQTYHTQGDVASCKSEQHKGAAGGHEAATRQGKTGEISGIQVWDEEGGRELAVREVAQLAGRQGGGEKQGCWQQRQRRKGRAQE